MANNTPNPNQNPVLNPSALTPSGYNPNQDFTVPNYTVPPSGSPDNQSYTVNIGGKSYTFSADQIARMMNNGGLTKDQALRGAMTQTKQNPGGSYSTSTVDQGLKPGDPGYVAPGDTISGGDVGPSGPSKFNLAISDSAAQPYMPQKSLPGDFSVNSYDPFNTSGTYNVNINGQNVSLNDSQIRKLESEGAIAKTSFQGRDTAGHAIFNLQGTDQGAVKDKLAKPPPPPNYAGPSQAMETMMNPMQAAVLAQNPGQSYQNLSNAMGNLGTTSPALTAIAGAAQAQNAPGPGSGAVNDVNNMITGENTIVPGSVLSNTLQGMNSAIRYGYAKAPTAIAQGELGRVLSMMQTSAAPPVVSTGSTGNSGSGSTGNGP